MASGSEVMPDHEGVSDDILNYLCASEVGLCTIVVPDSTTYHPAPCGLAGSIL